MLLELVLKTLLFFICERSGSGGHFILKKPFSEQALTWYSANFLYCFLAPSEKKKNATDGPQARHRLALGNFSGLSFLCCKIDVHSSTVFYYRADMSTQQLRERNGITCLKILEYKTER